MTVKEAFAQAFDEAFVMDAMPGNDMPRNTLPQEPNAPSGLKKNAAKMPTGGGGEPFGGEEETLEEHDAKHHPDGYKGGKCNWRDTHGMSGMTLAEAQQQGLARQVQGQKPIGQPMQPTPEMLEQQAQQIAENPQLMDQIPSAPLPSPTTVETEKGNLPAQTTVQEGILENLAGEAASGNTLAEEKLQEIKDMVADGTITQSGQPQQTGEAVAGGGAGQPAAQVVAQPTAQIGEQTAAQPAEQPVEQTPPKQRLYTTNGKFSRELLPEEVAIIAANPDKKGILQSMVDIEGQAGDYESGTPQFKDLANQYAALKRLFNGKSTELGGGGSGGGNEPPQTPPDASPGDGGGNGGDGSTPPPEGTEAPSGESGTETPSPDNSDAPQEGEGEEEPTATTSQGESPAPSDEEFQVGEGKYKIGGMTYTDVSGKGLLHTMLSSFMAGLRGEGIITGWDRISGAWDKMKRSESGEMVRDGISGALIQNTISEYASKEGLSDDAKMELSVIQDMISQAKSPKENMAAVKQFQAWKEKYAKELGEMGNSKTEVFKPLPNDYNGTTPPLSILDTPKGFDADKQFGDNVASAIQKRMGLLGMPVDSLESISVGPSATTVEFKVSPTFDITAAQSKKVKETLKAAIGSPISKVEYANGKTDVLSIQVTNPKMRDVSFADCLSSQEWKDFSEKASLPVALGKDASGKNVNLDLAKQPHTIVKGESASGKSVFLLSAINSLEMAKTPDKARLVLLDPKNEFRSQDGSPHLLYPRAQKPQDIANVVSSLKSLMDDRIKKVGGVVQDFDPTKNEFQGNSDRNITEYNKLHPEEAMPHILMTFDEVASIMKNSEVGDRVKQDLSQILALGRSVGIDCILATQRDDVASIPGEIQANAPAKIAFKAAPNDAKASSEEKSLAGSGDFIMTDKEGKQVRGRGCFISDKEVAAVPAYYRDNMKGSPTPTEGGGEGADGGDEEVDYSLPQEHIDAINDAVGKGKSVLFPVQDGFLDSFKGAFPPDWEITEVEVDGEKFWKAAPPSKNADGSSEGEENKPAEPKLKEGYTSVPPPAGSPDYKALIKDSDGKTVGGIHIDGTRIDFTKNGTSLKSDEKAPWESDETPSPEASGEENASEEEGEENNEEDKEEEESDWRKDGSREEAVATLTKLRDKMIAEAWDAYNKEEDTPESSKKVEKAIEAAEKFFDSKMRLVDLKFPPPPKGNKGGEDKPANEDNGGVPEEEQEQPAEEEDDDSPAATMKDIEESFNAQKEKLESSLSKSGGKVRDKKKLRAEIKSLKERFKAAKSKYEEGGSVDEMLDIFEPQEAKGGDGKENGKENESTSDSGEQEGPADDDKAKAAQEEQAKKNEQLRATVRPQKFYNAPGFKATARVPASMLKQMEDLLPDGWEFVTDNMFKAPARTKNGVVFIRHPTNGSYGRIFIEKDEKGKEHVRPEPQIDIDTTHPDYQGFVKNEDGTYGLTEEGKKAEQEYKRIRKYSKDDNEKSEVQKKFNRIRFGHDEAPDNMTIVANAVADALKLIEK